MGVRWGVEASRCLEGCNSAGVQTQSDAAHSLLASMEELQAVRIERNLSVSGRESRTVNREP